MIPLSLSRQTIGRSPALRLTTRVAVLLQQDGGLRGRSRSFSSSSSTTPTLLPPVLLPPSPPQPQVPLNERGIVGKVMNRYSIKESQSRIRVAESFFQAATRQGADPMWFGPGRIPRDFRNRHALLTMHIWLLHKRLISDKFDEDSALMIQEELFNILWEDTMCRIRKEGVNELLVNKNLLQVQQYTFLHLTNYDHIYTELLDKPAERLKELRKLVWQHIFVRDEAVKSRTDHLDRIAWYIEANYQNIIMEWPDDYYRSGRVAWVNLPDFDDLKDEKGTAMPVNPLHPEDILPEPWLKSITLKGIEYYWNPVTMESSWDRPGGRN